MNRGILFTGQFSCFDFGAPLYSNNEIVYTFVRIRSDRGRRRVVHVNSIIHDKHVPCTLAVFRGENNRQIFS